MGEIRMPVPWDGAREVCVRDGDGLDVFKVPKDDVRAGSTDGDIRDGEISDVDEAGEPDASEAAERADGRE